MHYPSAVHVVHRINDLGDNARDILLGAAQPRNQFSAFQVFHEQEDVVLIVEVAVQLHDIGVVQPVQDLQLQRELLLDAVLADHRFKYLFEGKQHACSSMPA